MNSRMISRITTIAAFNTAVFVILLLLSGATQSAASTGRDGLALLASQTLPPMGTGLTFTGPLIGNVVVTMRPADPTASPTATNTKQQPAPQQSTPQPTQQQATPQQPAAQQPAQQRAVITRTPPLINGQTATPTPQSCEFTSELPIKFYNPDDCRMNPLPGDRIAVYCDWYFREINVFGITNHGQGYPLTLFDYDELVLAGPKGLVNDVGANGVVIARVDSHNNFYVAWKGGPYGATGQGDFAKAFFCDINQTPPPSRTPRPPRPKAPIPVYTVTPTSTFTPTPITSK